MALDYIPASDSDFHAWEHNFLSYANAHLAGLGLDAADLAPHTAAGLDWEAARRDLETQQAAARAARQLKADRRAAFQDGLRALVRRLQASPSVGDDERAGLGITVRDTIATRPAAPATRPAASVSTAQRLRHEIRFFDTATPTRRAKPKGVLGCEIWVHIAPPNTPPGSPPGSPPSPQAEFTFLALATASPYRAVFPAAHAGQTAHYMLRWVTTGGKKGPWSETVSATIAG